MDLPQAARWKAALDKKITSLEKNGVFKMVLIPSIPTGHEIVGTRLQSIRMMLAIAAELYYKVHMLDVQTPFFNANIEEDVFVKMGARLRDQRQSRSSASSNGIRACTSTRPRLASSS